MKVPRDAPSGTGPVRYGNLLDDDGALHAGALVGLAVVAVGAGGVELVGHLLAGAVEVVLVGDGIGVDAGGDVVLVEDDVVGERLVVDELDGLALGDGDLVGLFVKGRRRGKEVRDRASTAPRMLLVFRRFVYVFENIENLRKTNKQLQKTYNNLSNIKRKACKDSPRLTI